MKYQDKDTGYRNDWLWLPLSGLKNVEGVKNSLTFYDPEGGRIDAWSLTDDHLIVPREYIPFERWETLPFRIEDRLYTNFPVLSGIQMRSALRGAVQSTAASFLINEGNGIISLGCGMGKTYITLHSWVEKRTPALVVVHTRDLEEQWKARILEHTTVAEDDIGLIRGPKMDWEHPITIASIKTLAARLGGEEFPEEMRNHFGVVAYDEVHHLGAPYFNLTAAIGKGLRWGLTATPDRNDGMDRFYQYHLGEILYRNYEQDIIPETWFVRTGVRLGASGVSATRDRFGDTNVPKLLNFLASDTARNQLIHSWLEQLVPERKVLFLSPRLEQLHHFHSLYESHPKTGLITGEGKGEDRKKALDTCDLIFATLQLAKEGLDRQDLDAIVLPFPVADEGVLRQVYGRIQRQFKGKKTPIVIVFEDENIKTIHEQCRRMRHLLTVLQYPYDIARE